jgi:hypothetical protein
MFVSKKEMLIFKNKMGWNIEVTQERYSLPEFSQMVTRFLVE